MTDGLIQCAMMVVGYLIHTLFKLYELDKRTQEPVRFLDVVWVDAERWRTMMLLLVMALLGFSGKLLSILALVGVTTEGMDGVVVVSAIAGYNIDSISQKLFSLGKAKPPTEA